MRSRGKPLFREWVSCISKFWLTGRNVNSVLKHRSENRRSPIGKRYAPYAKRLRANSSNSRADVANTVTWRSSWSRRSRAKVMNLLMKSGVLAGYPVVDVKVTLFFGSYHEVDSNENAFKIAGSIAFKEGMRRAHP